MKAIVYPHYGSPDVLQLMEVQKPTPKDNEVLVKVHAVSLNDWDWQLLLGIPFINRLINGLWKPKRIILGSDIAGCIEVVGKKVKQLKEGDEVYGDLSGEWGGFAEYVCAREDALVLKPPAMTFEQAAAIPQAGMLAVQGLLDIGQLRPGETLLINGAGGGVGTFGVQIAKQFGVEVTGVDHAGKLEMMRSVGFDHVIDYSKEEFTRNDQRYDLILDTKTNRSIFRYLNVLSPNGRYVTVGGDLDRLLQVLLLGPWIRMIYKKQVCIVPLKQNKDLAYMNELFIAGKMKPVIDGPYPLSEVPEAMRYFGNGNHKGKVIIIIGERHQ